MGLRASDWCELLFGLVPEPRLIDAFMRAAKDHTTGFPVTAYEVKNAWSTIQTEEREQVRETGDKPSAMETCEIRDKHVDDFRAKASDGLIELYDPSTDSTRVVPCYSCRRQAFTQRQAECIQSKTGAGVPASVRDAVDAVIEARQPVKPVQDDGREFLGWCSKEFIQDYLRNRPDPNSNSSVRKFSYALFNRVWVVRLDESECQRIGVMVHHAADYIKLGPKDYAKLNGITLPEEPK